MRINLDCAAGAPLAPEVTQAMAQAMELVGNPSSVHRQGQAAREVMERARAQVAALIGAKPDEIYFTSCGTESNNWAIRGLLAAHKRPRGHVIVSAIEHPSILLIVKRFEREGMDVTYLPVTAEGVVTPEALRAALRPETALVSVMHANGEIGTVEPIAELAAMAHAAGALCHTDAIASVGHVPVRARELGVDALSVAADQFGGPAGAAALYLKDGVRILPLLDGGGQETGGRSGTENLIGIAGLGAAAELAATQLAQRAAHEQGLRDRLKAGLASLLGGRFSGSWTNRLPHNLHVCVEGLSSESLVLGLDQAGISAGLGSACNSKAMRPSHVLKAIGLSDDQAQGAILLTMGTDTTEMEIDQAIDIIFKVVEQLGNITKLTARS